MIPVGAVLGALYNRWAQRSTNPEKATRLGTLMATSLIVGESLYGVIFAGIVGFSGKEDPLAIVPKGFGGVTTVVGVVLFVVVVRALYRMAGREGTRS